MLRVQNLSLPLDYDHETLLRLSAKALCVPAREIRSVSVGKKSVDARRRDDVHFVVSADVELCSAENTVLKRLKPGIAVPPPSFEPIPARPLPPPSDPPVVVGLGPGGLFAALYLARQGLRPVVLERGEPVEVRARTVERFAGQRILDEESNIQFGEGGAGAFSDGKLTTGIKDDRCRQVLYELHAHGAPDDILLLAHPHIGTDRLPEVVRAIREEIISLGGTVLFRTRWTGIETENGSLSAVRVQTAQGEKVLPASCVLAAVGHSADDTQRMLIRAGLQASHKPFSIGFRIEHLQSFINSAQYGRFAGHPALPPAEYKLNVRLPDGRGVYTFCMCPGGTVAPAASRHHGVCVNGMSPYLRDGTNANAAVLVDVRPEDFPPEDLMAGFRLQKTIEEAAFRLGGENYDAPCQLAEDYLAGRPSAGPRDVLPSYRPGVRWTDLNGLFPQPYASDLREGLRQLNARMRGFSTGGAVLTAPETRSSCPIRFYRDEHCRTSIPGVYLIGEGAGYAGGIMSAAVDGLRNAEEAVCCLRKGSFLG